MNMPKPLAVNIHQNSKYDSNGPAGSFPPCGLARPPLNQVLNIHEGHLPRMMKNMFIEAVILRRKDQQRLFPTAFLFNDVGLQIWSDITKSETYSQTLEEIRLLEKYGDDIARSIPPGSSLLDIGASDVWKVIPLLDALEAAQIPTQYFAVDLSEEALKRGMKTLTSRYKYVKCFGLWGTFVDAMRWAHCLFGPICVLSLGSFFGNDKLDHAVQRLSTWREIMRPDDRMLLGIDGRQDKTHLWNAYHDSHGLFERFVRNGLENSNSVLGCRWYYENDWTIEGVISDDPLVHVFKVRALNPVVCEELGLQFEVDDVIDCFEVFKYGPSTMQSQFAAAGFQQEMMWTSPVSPHSFHDYLLSPVT